MQQDLFDYLANELNTFATQTQMHEIERIVLSKHEQQIKDAYNQGFEDCLFETHKDTINLLQQDI